MDRRNFIKVCTASAAALAAGVHTQLVHSSSVRDYTRAKLVDADGQPLKAASLSQAEAYIFGYPYAGTPCFLISLPSEAKAGAALKTAEGEEYTFAGGVGPNKNLVAYLAVCTHQLAHPEKDSSQISYIPGNSETSGHSATITCCAHNSAFDPAAGGKALTGKSSQPLVAVRLEHDAASDEIHATGMYGADLIDEYFKKFKGKLNKEFGIGKYRDEASGTVQAVLLSKYTAEADTC
ncbi:MAG: Rieske 2Fe-2S domain-containing protein [Gallionellaceae bacterium]|nr:Rieske 2Fe-2S domain-containing protein [Gallionellaceae bacterium]